MPLSMCCLESNHSVYGMIVCRFLDTSGIFVIYCPFRSCRNSAACVIQHTLKLETPLKPLAESFMAEFVARQTALARSTSPSHPEFCYAFGASDGVTLARWTLLRLFRA